MKARIVALSCSICFAALAAACTDAERCELSQAGCKPDLEDSALERNDGCAPGTSFDEDTGLCVDDDGPSAGNGGSQAGRGGSDPEPIQDCPDDSIEEACQVFCEAYCQNQERLCVESRCAPGDCEAGSDFIHECAAACEDDVECAQDLCLTQIDVECEDFGYTTEVELDGEQVVQFVSLCDGDDPRCVPGADVGCSDLCGTTGDGVGADHVDNGRCEDGGEGSETPQTPLCNRGTDCTDCGVRLCEMPGGPCTGHGDCCGFYDNGAFCVELSSGPTCLATCNETRTCEGDLRCLLVDDEENRVCAP